MPQKITLVVDKVERTTVEVTLTVSDAELDSMTHSQLEQRAVDSVGKSAWEAARKSRSTLYVAQIKSRETR